MNYADTHEFSSQTRPAVPHVRPVIAVAEKLNSMLKSLIEHRLDPTRLSKTEQQEAGIMECQIDWYKAWHAPLVK